MHLILHFSPRIKQALDKGKPILAMESTVLTHGLPYPENLEILKILEELCLELEVEPATIIILDGKIHIGMTEMEKTITSTKWEAGKNYVNLIYGMFLMP